MGKKDVSTETKLDPMAEKARNIGYNATLGAMGYGSLSDYGQGGGPASSTPNSPRGRMGGVFGGGGSGSGAGGGGPIGPQYPQIAPNGGAPMPGQAGVNPGVTQYGGPMVNSMAPGEQPNGMAQLSGVSATMNSSAGNPAYEQDYVGPGSSVAGYDKGFGDAYAGTAGAADAAARASQGGYDAAGRFLDPAQAAADSQARMNPYMSGVNDPAKAAYEESLAMANRSASQSALSAGAFGGSRSGVAAGEATRGATMDYNLANAQRLENAYYNAQGQTQAAGQLGANLGMGSNQLAQSGYMQQGGFSDQGRQIQQNKYDTKLKDLGILSDSLNGGTSGTTVVERGGGGFFG